MPKRNTVPESGAAQKPDVAATVPPTAADGATVALPPDVPDTAATRALWAALNANPGATAGELAEIAGVNRSTASKALATMAEIGRATRKEGGREGGKRLPDRWQAVVSDEDVVSANSAPPAADAELAGAEAAAELVAVEAPVAQPEVRQQEEATAPAPAEAGPDESDAVAARESVGAVSLAAGVPVAEQPVDAAGGSGRLRPGALREIVIDYLRQRPDQDLSPSAIGKGLDRSAGAVANACDRSVTDGLLTQTSAKPRRYRWARSQG